MKSSRPNVIVLVSHDTGRHLPSYGVKALETPHFDRLARESVRFTQAFSTSPLCC